MPASRVYKKSGRGHRPRPLLVFCQAHGLDYPMLQPTGPHDGADEKLPVDWLLPDEPKRLIDLETCVLPQEGHSIVSVLNMDLTSFSKSSLQSLHWYS